AFGGRGVVCPDVSGSMRAPVTGHRGGATTAVRCVDVAALVASAVLRRNPEAEVLPFEHDVLDVQLSARDSVMTNAAALARVGGGGTSCSVPLALLNRRRAAVDLVVLVSDNESWADPVGGRGTATMREWNRLRERNPKARMVCVDLHGVNAGGTTWCGVRVRIPAAPASGAVTPVSPLLSPPSSMTAGTTSVPGSNPGGSSNDTGP